MTRLRPTAALSTVARLFGRDTAEYVCALCELSYDDERPHCTACGSPVVPAE